jgi:HEAT repeat protein
VVLDILASEQDVPVLSAALSDPESLVHRHVAWALANTASPAAFEALRARSDVEHAPELGAVVKSALGRLL